MRAFLDLTILQYSFTNIKKMEPLIDARMTDWIERLKTSFARTGKNFDFAPWAHYVAYDVISELAFGAAIGFIKQGEDVAGLVQANHVGLPVFGFMSRLYPFTTWIKDTWFGKKYLVASAEQDNGFGVMLRFRDKLLAERLEKNGAGTPIGRTDFMQSLVVPCASAYCSSIRQKVGPDDSICNLKLERRRHADSADIRQIYRCQDE